MGQLVATKFPTFVPYTSRQTIVGKMPCLRAYAPRGISHDPRITSISHTFTLFFYARRCRMASGQATFVHEVFTWSHILVTRYCIFMVPRRTSLYTMVPLKYTCRWCKGLTKVHCGLDLICHGIPGMKYIEYFRINFTLLTIVKYNSLYILLTIHGRSFDISISI